MKENKEIALRKLAKSWNNLDIEYVENILSDDFTYKSQWSSLPVIDKEAFLSYLTRKFKALRDCNDGDLYSVTAEIAIYRRNSPCIVLSQKADGEFRQVAILVKLRQDKIHRLDIVSISNSKEIVLTGDRPK